MGRILMPKKLQPAPGNYSLMPTQDSDSGEAIATFGEAKLIKKFDGTYELVGGSEADRAEMAEWIALFMQGDVVRGS